MTTLAGTETRAPTSRSVAVSRSVSPSALEQHIGQDRQGLARLDHVVNHLETFEERITIHTDFHVRSPLFGEEKEKNFVVVRYVGRCG